MGAGRSARPSKPSLVSKSDTARADRLDSDSPKPFVGWARLFESEASNSIGSGLHRLGFLPVPFRRFPCFGYTEKNRRRKYTGRAPFARGLESRSRGTRAPGPGAAHRDPLGRPARSRPTGEPASCPSSSSPPTRPDQVPRGRHPGLPPRGHGGGRGLAEPFGSSSL
jgi:hypothetical protein